VGRGNDWRKGQFSITEAEKMMIRAARKEEMSYNKISKLIRPSRMTIQKFCKEEGIAVEVSEANMLAARKRGDAQQKILSECQWCGRLYKARSDARLPVCGKLC